MGRWKKKKFERFIQEDLEILDAGSEGKAVARIGELVVFVPFAVPGDIADVEVLSKSSARKKSSPKAGSFASKSHHR